MPPMRRAVAHAGYQGEGIGRTCLELAAHPFDLEVQPGQAGLAIAVPLYWFDFSALAYLGWGGAALLVFLVPTLLATSANPDTREAMGCLGCFVEGIEIVVGIFALLSIFN